MSDTTAQTTQTNTQTNNAPANNQASTQSTQTAPATPPVPPAQNAGTQAQNGQTTDTAASTLKNDLQNDKSFVDDAMNDFAKQNNAQNQDDGGAGNVKKTDDNLDPLDTVPESYSLNDAEGQPLANEKVSEFQTAFKDAKLTSRQAQKMYEAYNQAQQKWLDTLYKQNLQMRHDNLEKIKSDRDLGGENLSKTKMYVGTVMDKYGTQELRSFLNESGLGSNPELVRVFAKIGRDLSPDDFVAGRGHSNNESSIEQAKRMYPKSPELWR